ncbi:MAG TPA: GNAT family N-acetyltransferase [Chitinophagaceae bacterium]
MNHKNGNKECSIIRLDENKLKDLEILYKEVYKHKPVKNYFHKKYDTAYTGAQYIGHIAYNSENIPIACFGVIPCFIQYNDQIVLSGQAVDAITLSQYRYEGFFVELVKKTFDLCRASGIQLVFGFPNQNSYHGLVHKLGWKMTEYMERFTIPLDSFPLESLCQHFEWSKWVYKKYTDWILRKYLFSEQGLANSVMAEGFGGVHRDDRYLKYKTYSDTKVIKTGTAKVWVKIQNGLFIGDLQTSEYDFDIVIDTIKKIASRLGIKNIFFQISPGTSLHALFSKSFKSQTSFPVIFMDMGSGIPLSKLKFTFADIDIF